MTKIQIKAKLSLVKNMSQYVREGYSLNENQQDNTWNCTELWIFILSTYISDPYLLFNVFSLIIWL